MGQSEARTMEALQTYAAKGIAFVLATFPSIGEPGDAPPPSLPPAWYTELDDLAVDVIAGLTIGETIRLENGDSVLLPRLDDLYLAGVWPHPDFEPLLLAILDSEDPFTVKVAARALINYPDAEARERVEALQEDNREYSAGCSVFRLGTQIADLIADHDCGDTFHPYETTLPLDGYGSAILAESCVGVGSPGRMTIPRAIEVLAHPALGMRLRAFLWLAERSVVLDTERLLSAWPMLSTQEKQGIWFRGATLRIGRQRMHNAIETILEMEYSGPADEPTDIELLLTGAGLEVHSARGYAMDFIEGRRTMDALNPDRVESCWEAVYKVVVLLSTEDDLQQALDWRTSPHDLRRAAGLCILATIEHPTAQEAVLEYLRDRSQWEATPYGFDPLRYLSVNWRDESFRWRYLREFDSLLLQYSSNEEPEWISYDYQAAYLIRTLERQTGAWNGPDGTGHFNRPVREIVRDTSMNWHNWLIEHDPSTTRN